MSRIFNFEIFPPCYGKLHILLFDANPIRLELDIWLLSYEQCINVENNIQQRNLNSFFANISKTIFTTSDSFSLIISLVLTISRTFQKSFEDTYSEVQGWNSVHIIRQNTFKLEKFYLCYYNGDLQYAYNVHFPSSADTANTLQCHKCQFAMG